MGPGLVNQGCKHDEHKQEYIDSSYRHDNYRCMGCGETLSQPIDCGSGC